MAAGKFSFFESFDKVASQLGDADRLALFDAMRDFAFRGVAPNFEGTMAMLWDLIEPNIESSLRAQKNGAQGGRRNTSKDGFKPDAKPKGKSGVKTSGKNQGFKPQVSSDMDRDMDREEEEEKEKERDREEEREEGRGASERPRPPFSASDEDAEFGAAALEAFNRITGSGIQCLSPSDWTRLARIRASGRTLEDVEAVVRSKLDEWGGDAKMGRYVRPSTLFGQKFEEYLAAARKQEAVADEFAEYD